MALKVLELFAGIGACSAALKKLGIDYEIVDAVEIDKYAITSFNAIYGTNFAPQDISQWDKDIKADLIMHGSPCFRPGTLVNTKDGFKPIETITNEDYIKNFNGEWEKVKRVGYKVADNLVDIKTSATHLINTTANHPFYVMRNKTKLWIKAGDLLTNDYVAIPINQKEEEIVWNGCELNYNGHTEISNNLPFDDYRFWYLVGRFIGDGWVVRRRDRNNNISGIKVCCAKDELDELKEKIGDLFNYCVVEDRTTYKLQFTNKELGEFCQMFGIGAYNKHIPQMVLDSKKEYLKGIIDGIVDSDAHRTEDTMRITSTSKQLVYGIGEAILKVYNLPYHIHKSKRKPTCVIEGRTVNQRDSYDIIVRKNYNLKINYIDDGYLWARVRKVDDISHIGESGYVYNLETEDTHTYCVQNVVVHNCQDFSLAGLQAGGDEGTGTRSSLMYETLRIVKKLKPRYVIWENVANLVSEKHFHNFANYINRMGDMGYASAWKVLNSKDFGIPQNRERVFTVSVLGGDTKDLFGYDLDFDFPKPMKLNLCLADMLEDEVDEKYYLSDAMLQYIRADNDKWTGNNDESIVNKPIASTVTTKEGMTRCDASSYISEREGSQST